MTEPKSEQLFNAHHGLHLGVWSLYGVIRGEPAPSNHGWGDHSRVYAADPGKPPWFSTANRKGFTEFWYLTQAGSLVLHRFDYDVPGIPSREVNETLTGDFYIVLKSAPMGPRLYVPFRDGFIVLDRSAWLHEAYTGLGEKELRLGCSPEFPERALLSHEIDFPPDTERN